MRQGYNVKNKHTSPLIPSFECCDSLGGLSGRPRLTCQLSLTPQWPLRVRGTYLRLGVFAEKRPGHPADWNPNTCKRPVLDGARASARAIWHLIPFPLGADGTRAVCAGFPCVHFHWCPVTWGGLRSNVNLRPASLCSCSPARHFS